MVPSRERVQFINFSKSFNRPSGPFHIKCVRNRVRVGDGYSEEFGIGVGVQQGSALWPLLFLVMLEALFREFYKGCPWRILYTNYLMIIAESLRCC